MSQAKVKQMEDAVIVAGVRTAIGKLMGSLESQTPDCLAAAVIGELLRRTNVEGQDVDEVIFGQAKQTADCSNVARVAALRAGIPETVPGYTVHRQCGSGVQALNSAAMQIQTNNARIIIAGGVESMSTAPYYVNGIRGGIKAGNLVLKDPNTESQPGSQPIEKYGDLRMGMTAENIAQQYGITRQEQDLFALQSQERAAQAVKEGVFREEIVPYEVKRKKQTILFDQDEHLRQTSMEALGKLQPAFKAGGSVTAGNSSGRNDGAAALMVMAKQTAREMGFREAYRVVSFASAGVEPQLMGLGPIPATRQALEKAGLELEQMDVIELNEAFAAQALAFFREFKLDYRDPRVNPNGGAIAMGHPIGGTGAILLTKLIHEMHRKEARFGLVTLCIAGGMGIATILERECL